MTGDEGPRLTYVGSFDNEGVSHLVIPAGALARAEQTIAAERLVVGDHVSKVGGDYRFEGVVVASFAKRDGKTWRYVAENADRVLHIFSAAQLARSPKEPT